MKKRILPALCLVFCLFSLSVQAMTPFAITGAPSLTFSRTTANCSVSIQSDKASDKIAGTLTLYQGSTVVTSWSGEGDGRLNMSKTRSVTSGKSYRLVFSYSVNGVSKPDVEVSATCP